MKIFLLSKRGICYILIHVAYCLGRPAKIQPAARPVGLKKVVDMALLEKWREEAYNETAGQDKLQKLWAAYFQEEKEIYAQLLKNPDEVVRGTVKELADKYQVSIKTMTGFLDGINDSLKEPNPIEEMEEDTQVNLGFEKALLYKNMVAAEADRMPIRYPNVFTMVSGITRATTPSTIYRAAVRSVSHFNCFKSFLITAPSYFLPQHFLYFLPLPQGQGSLG